MPFKSPSVAASRTSLLASSKAADKTESGGAGDFASRPAIHLVWSVLVAMSLATSPALCPPMPSATANSPAETNPRWVLISKLVHNMLSSLTSLRSPVSQL